MDKEQFITKMANRLSVQPAVIESTVDATLQKTTFLRKGRPPLWLCTLVVLSVGLLFLAGTARATALGTVVAWGCGGGHDVGQCNVPRDLSGVTAIAVGDLHSLVVENGTVVAWGCGGGFDAGQCNVPSGVSGVTAVSAARTSSMALKSDGTVVAWGCEGSDADFGQCPVPSGLSEVRAIAAGSFHSLALKSDGTVVAWGCGGATDFEQCSVPNGLSGVRAIAAGYAHSIAVKSDGTVVAWGCGDGFDYGQCTVPSGLSGVTAVAAGQNHSLALKSDGTVVAWGCGGAQNVGHCSVPSGLSGVTAIAAAEWDSLALKADGTVVAWGCLLDFTNSGQCSVPSGLSGVTAVAAGFFHSLALVGGAPVTPFAAFTAKLEIELGPRRDDAFAVQSSFALGAGSNGLDPLTENVKLELAGGTASFTTTIPAGSFTEEKNRRFDFEGTINGVDLQAKITRLDRHQFKCEVEGEHADLTGIANPVTVTLTIGDDSGSTTVRAKFKHHKGDHEDGEDGEN